MEIQQCVKKSQDKVLVPDDKFDKHMKKARTDDVESRKSQFVMQTEQSLRKYDGRRNLKNSIY